MVHVRKVMNHARIVLEHVRKVMVLARIVIHHARQVLIKHKECVAHARIVVAHARKSWLMQESHGQARKVMEWEDFYEKDMAIPSIIRGSAEIWT